MARGRALALRLGVFATLMITGLVWAQWTELLGLGPALVTAVAAGLVGGVITGLVVALREARRDRDEPGP